MYDILNQVHVSNPQEASKKNASFFCFSDVLATLQLSGGLGHNLVKVALIFD